MRASLLSDGVVDRALLEHVGEPPRIEAVLQIAIAL